MKKLLLGVMVIAVLGTLYVWGALKWNYSTGERAGWVQKFSRKGWVCKTWEGELAMVSMPGAAQEKFYFTVWDDDVARQINKVMGRRVSLHYEEKVGLPTTCFGDTRHWVIGISVVPEIPLAPGINMPVPPDGVPQGQPQPTLPQPQVQPQSPAPQPALPSPAPDATK
ncbi:MAG TPA: hypothetical protein VFR86_16205 [Burkholderiaceae bacterium]|nr:hypothetical protein [Burkholderiaceae bacterium]